MWSEHVCYHIVPEVSLRTRVALDRSIGRDQSIVSWKRFPLFRQHSLHRPPGQHRQWSEALNRASPGGQRRRWVWAVYLSHCQGLLSHHIWGACGLISSTKAFVGCGAKATIRLLVRIPVETFEHAVGETNCFVPTFNYVGLFVGGRGRRKFTSHDHPVIVYVSD